MSKNQSIKITNREMWVIMESLGLAIQSLPFPRGGESASAIQELQELLMKMMRFWNELPAREVNQALKKPFKLPGRSDESDSDRICTIEDASIEDSDGAGDGAYDLLDQSGSPSQIGSKIADQLSEGGLATGVGSVPLPLFLNVRIRIDDERSHRRKRKEDDKERRYLKSQGML